MAKEIQGFTDSGDLHNFHDAMKRNYKPSHRSLAPVRALYGSVLLTGKSEIISGWNEHYSTLLNVRNPADPRCLDVLSPFPPNPKLNEPPTMQEVSVAITNLKNNKSPGGDGIPALLLKYGGPALSGAVSAFARGGQ